MAATKAIWTITWGIIHGEALGEHRIWLDADAWHEDRIESFMAKSNEAAQYAQDKMDPEQVNWVVMEFVWT